MTESSNLLTDVHSAGPRRLYLRARGVHLAMLIAIVE